MDTQIPKPITDAVISMLLPYAPDLTVEKLESAIHSKQEKDRLEKLLTRKEAAKALNVSIPTIDRMLRDGDLPHHHIRRTVRITLSAIKTITKDFLPE